MAIDPKIKEAIEGAVAEAGQPPGLARKLMSWFEAIATGNEDIANRQSAYRHLELLYEEVQTGTAAIDDKLDEIIAAETDEVDAP